MSNESLAPARPRNWLAIASLVMGLLGFAVSLTAPIPFVPVISILTWPFGFLGIVFSRLANAKGDSKAEFRSRWGLRLGCLGWLIQFTISIVKWTLFLALATAAVQTWFGIQPTPTP